MTSVLRILTDQLIYIFALSLIVQKIVQHWRMRRFKKISNQNFSSSDNILQVAYSALKENKLILEIAPNAAVCSSRKYAENITRYLIRYFKLQLDFRDVDDSFSSMLYVLNQSKQIKDQSVIQGLYQIKDIGNDAVHAQVCDLKTARDIYDQVLAIDTWFRRCINEKC